MSAFSIREWHEYCEKKVRPQHEHSTDQLARLDRLLTQSVADNWRKLAADLKRGAPAQTWQEALHEVIGVLIFPPSINSKSDPAVRRWLEHKRRSRETGLPLLPGAIGKKSAEARWLALYLKTFIIPGFFNRPHHNDIAELVNAVLGLTEDGLSADDVRAVKPYHFRGNR